MHNYPVIGCVFSFLLVLCRPSGPNPFPHSECGSVSGDQSNADPWGSGSETLPMLLSLIRFYTFNHELSVFFIFSINICWLNNFLIRIYSRVNADPIPVRIQIRNNGHASTVWHWQQLVSNFFPRGGVQVRARKGVLNRIRSKPVMFLNLLDWDHPWEFKMKQYVDSNFKEF
jgi:hypothetical protein